MSKVRPPYQAEFRQQMVELLRSSRSPAQLSCELGVTAQSFTKAAIVDSKPLPGKEAPYFEGKVIYEHQIPPQ